MNNQAKYLSQSDFLRKLFPGHTHVTDGRCSEECRTSQRKRNRHRVYAARRRRKDVAAYDKCSVSLSLMVPVSQPVKIGSHQIVCVCVCVCVCVLAMRTYECSPYLYYY